MAAFAVSDVATKLVAKTHPFGEVIALRGLITILVIGMLIVALGNLHSLRPAFSAPVLIRSALDALAAGAYIAALVHMPIANAAALIMIQPLVLVVFSVAFYAEVVGWRRWTAIAIGFVGVLFIVRPTPEAFNGWAMFGLGAAFIGAAREMFTRRLDPALPTLVIAFYSIVALTLVGGVVGLTEQWQPLAGGDLTLLGLTACFFCLAIYLLVRAFRGVDISVVAPFRYTFLVWAGFAGYIFFSELPDFWSIAGMTLIVGSGLYTLYREAVRCRAAVSPN